MPRGIARYRAPDRQSTLVLDSRNPTAIASDQNDYDLSVGACYNLSTSGGDRSITGIAGGYEGRVIQLSNVGTFYIYLLNESSASLAQDRIVTGLSSGERIELAPKQSIFLAYNVVLSRWLIMHSPLAYDPDASTPGNALLRGNRFARSGGVLNNSAKIDPETNTPLATMLGGLRDFKRSGGTMTKSLFSLLGGSQQGFLKLAQSIRTSGDIPDQAFGAVTSIRASFTLPASGFCLVAVCGTAHRSTVGSAIVATAIGARFDSDTAQALNQMSGIVGSGSDFINDVQLFGIWGKTLSAGAHTADLCWGNGSGQSWSLQANSTYPAMVAVLYPG